MKWTWLLGWRWWPQARGPLPLASYHCDNPQRCPLSQQRIKRVWLAEIALVILWVNVLNSFKRCAPLCRWPNQTADNDQHHQNHKGIVEVNRVKKSTLMSPRYSPAEILVPIWNKEEESALTVDPMHHFFFYYYYNYFNVYIYINTASASFHFYFMWPLTRS